MSGSTEPQAASPSRAAYQGGASPFRIGLAPCDPGRWLERDATEAERVAAAAFFADPPDDLHLAEPGAAPAVAEAAARVEAHLGAAGPVDAPPLLRARHVSAEDLLVMERRPGPDWRLTAGALLFPSSWRLQEKLGLAMQDVHAPVPGFGPSTRNAAVIARIFDSLALDAPVERHNWSLYPDSDFRHSGRTSFLAPSPRPHLRVERQTLLKLPETGAILFTVRIRLTPLAALSAEEAAELGAAVAALSPEERRYKNLPANSPLVAALQDRRRP